MLLATRWNFCPCGVIRCWSRLCRRFCSLHAQRLSRLDQVKPWATWSGVMADPVWTGEWTSWGYFSWKWPHEISKQISSLLEHEVQSQEWKSKVSGIQRLPDFVIWAAGWFWILILALPLKLCVVLNTICTFLSWKSNHLILQQFG